MPHMIQNVGFSAFSTIVYIFPTNFHISHFSLKLCSRKKKLFVLLEWYIKWHVWRILLHFEKSCWPSFQTLIMIEYCLNHQTRVVFSFIGYVKAFDPVDTKGLVKILYHCAYQVRSLKLFVVRSRTTLLRLMYEVRSEVCSVRYQDLSRLVFYPHFPGLFSWTLSKNHSTSYWRTEMVTTTQIVW